MEVEADEPQVYASFDFDFERFCRHVYSRLVGALTLQSGDRATAEELAQESLTRLWLRRNHVSQLKSPEAWVFRVGFNLANSRYRRLLIERRANRRARPVDAVVEDGADSLAVRTAVLALPKRQRSALVLRYFADLSVKETAMAMDCAPGTVKALTSQAIARLRTEFDIVPVEDESEANVV